MDEVYNLIRGLAPYPAAFSFLQGKKMKIYKAEKVQTKPSIAAGELETDRKTFIQFACTDGFIAVKEIQLEGKKKMLIEDLLRGYRWG